MSRKPLSALILVTAIMLAFNSSMLEGGSSGTMKPAASPNPKLVDGTLGANTTLAGYECEFHANWSTPLGELHCYVFGTNASGSGWQNSTHLFSGETWSNQTLPLPIQHNALVTWQMWANNTNGLWNTTGLQRLYTTWNSSKTIGWVFDRVVDRLVNSTFPLVKEWNERAAQTTNMCDAELLVGALAYGYEQNETWLNHARRYGDWLSGQPVCRLFQIFNLTSQSWQEDVRQTHAGKMLTLLAQLALHNSTYEPMLHEAVRNFTDIFIPSNTSRGYDIRYVNGSTFYNQWGMPLEYTSIQAFAYSVVGVTYAGYVLSNETWKQKGIDMILNYTLSPIGIPYHQIDQEGNWWGGILSKEDATIGMYLLTASTVYAITGNETAKESIRAVAEAAIEHVWVEDRQLFRYQTSPNSGNPPLGGGKLSVHGFGALDEGLLQAGLIWDNNTWITYGVKDYCTLVVQGHILVNDLVCHAVRWNTTSYWVDSSMHYDNDVGWNKYSHRVGYVFYVTNRSGLHRNTTFLESYRELYNSQNAHHLKAMGLVQGLNVSNFDLVTPSYPNYNERYDKPAPLYVSLQCFEPLRLEDVNINDLTDIFKTIGLPLMGVRRRNTPPTQPIIDITPHNPTTTDDLTCTIVAPSVDSDFDTVTYTYEWLRDAGTGFEPVPSLTTSTTKLSATVNSSNTQKGQAWQCRVTPNDGVTNGTSAQDEVAVINSPPTISPYYPVGDPTIKEGESQEFNITKSDADNDPLTVMWLLNQISTGVTADNYTFTTDYNSSGSYNVTAVVSDSESQSAQEWTLTVENVERDVAIATISIFKTIVGEGYLTRINATIENQGEITENINITLYANATVIYSSTNISLAGGNSTIIAFTWNTASFAKGNYTISATTPSVPGETDTIDNTLLGGHIFITIPGDVDGDREVNIYDIVAMADAYDSEIGQPKYHPNLDIDGDGDVDIYDIVIAADNYDENW